jgi:5-methyltetrahydrofolate--homocysteine methyltransferase
MKYVIQDLERQGFGFPVICGGAALTRKYVEDDLRREYSSAVFYAEDAFAGLHYMQSLAGDEREQAIAAGRVVKEFARRAAVSGGEAPAIPRDAVPPAPSVPQPPFWGRRVCRDFDLREIFPYINETALFKNQWQLKTASQQDYLRLVEEKFRPILRQLESEVIAAGWFAPAVVYGFFPCQGEGNDLIIYESQGCEGGAELRAGCAAPRELREIVRFTLPRQREGRRLSITDYFLPRASGLVDVVGMSVVTIGRTASLETQRLFEKGEYTRYLYLHGLSVETAEALAEYTHKKIRQELGIAGDDAERIGDLFHQKYRGSRYSFGYPACPNLEDQTKLFALLKPEEAIGVRLTSTWLIEPEQSTSAIVVHHPGAKYFVV